MTSGDMAAAIERWDAWRGRMLQFMEGYDAILCPPCAFAELPHGASSVGDANSAFIAYHKMEHVDYIDILGTMTAALTAPTEPVEYKSRILAMAAVYWSLGIQDGDLLHPANYATLMRKKSEWAVLSFRLIAANNPVLRMASAAAQHKFDGSHIYRFEIFRWGRESEDPADPKISLVEILEEVTAYSDGKSVIKKVGNAWESDVSIPT